MASAERKKTQAVLEPSLSLFHWPYPLSISCLEVFFPLYLEVIRNLTVFERDYTETYRQGSLAVKSVIAQMINTILIPIITAFYVKNKNFYYENGLVDNIFMLSVSTIIVPPIVLFVNPWRILTAILRCYYSRPSNLYTIQLRSCTRTKRSTTFCKKEYSFKSDISLFIQSVCLCLSASLSLCSLSSLWLPWLATSSCTGFKNIRFSIGTDAQSQELSLLTMLCTKWSVLDQLCTVLAVWHGLTFHRTEFLQKLLFPTSLRLEFQLSSSSFHSTLSSSASAWANPHKSQLSSMMTVSSCPANTIDWTPTLKLKVVMITRNTWRRRETR